MINFLPPEQKALLKEEKKFKLSVVSGMVILSASVIFFLSLSLIKINLTGLLEIKKINLAEKNKALDILRINEKENEISKYNSIISDLAAFYKSQPRPLSVISAVEQNMPGGVYLSSFDFSGSRVSISGFSPDREKLLEFKENLEKTAGFKEFYFPASNLLEKEKINFDISFLQDGI